MAPSAVRGLDRDAERGDQAADVDQGQERQASELVEAVGRQVREPLLVLPRTTGRQGHQPVAVGKAVLHDVAPRDEAEPGVPVDPQRRERVMSSASNEAELPAVGKRTAR